MDVYECLRDRRTVRGFKPTPVPETVVEKILKAARWAPSSRNQQPWHLIVIRDRETLAKIGRIVGSGTFIGAAPIAIAVIMENADSPALDAGRALQQMEIMAWSEGLGTCFVTLTEDEGEEITELLGIPSRMDLITVMPFGYRPDGSEVTDASADERRRWFPVGRGIPRRPLSEMAHRERFGVRYQAT